MIFINVGHPDSRKDRLTPLHFAAQSYKSPARLFSIQIRNHSHCVWQILKDVHGCATLIVDKHKIDLVRVVIQSETCEEREQQLTLA